MAFYCGRSRNIVTAAPTDSVARVKQALVAGGISNADRPAHVRHTPGIRTWEDLELIYAGQLMEVSAGLRARAECREQPKQRLFVHDMDRQEADTAHISAP